MNVRLKFTNVSDDLQTLIDYNVLKTELDFAKKTVRITLKTVLHRDFFPALYGSGDLPIALEFLDGETPLYQMIFRGRMVENTVSFMKSTGVGAHEHGMVSMVYSFYHFYTEGEGVASTSTPVEFPTVEELKTKLA